MPTHRLGPDDALEFAHQPPTARDGFGFQSPDGGCGELLRSGLSVVICGAVALEADRPRIFGQAGAVRTP